MRKNKIKTISYAFQAPITYKEAGYSGTDFRDAVNTLFPIFWAKLAANIKKELMQKYEDEFDALDLREESK
ncbi:MAG: hypothetical protein WC648_05155 [Candidatus Paceibacterota bacterium]|jgi:hypothetical protein